MNVEDFHKLPVGKETEPGWRKLKWRPIKNCTYNFYAIRKYSHYRPLGVLAAFCPVSNYGRSYSGFSTRLCLWWVEIEFWVHWNIKVCMNGFTDTEKQRPFVVPDE